MKGIYNLARNQTTEAAAAEILHQHNKTATDCSTEFSLPNNKHLFDFEFLTQFFSEIHMFSSIHVFHELALIFQRILTHPLIFESIICFKHNEAVFELFVNALVYIVRVANDNHITPLIYQIFEAVLKIEQMNFEFHEKTKSQLCHPCAFLSKFVHSFSNTSSFSGYLSEDVLEQEAMFAKVSTDRIMTNHNVNDLAFFGELFDRVKGYESDQIKIRIFNLYFKRYLKELLAKPGHFEKDIKKILSKYIRFVEQICCESEFKVRISVSQKEQIRTLHVRDFKILRDKVEFAEEVFDIIVNYLTLRPFWVEENISLALLIGQYLKPRLQLKSVEEVIKGPLLQTAKNFTKICRNLLTYPASKPSMNKILGFLDYSIDKFQCQSESKQDDQLAADFRKVCEDVKAELTAKALVDLNANDQLVETIFTLSTLEVRLGFKQKIKVLAGQKHYVNYFFPKYEIDSSKTRVLLWRVRVLDLDLKFSLIFKKKLTANSPDPTRNLDQVITIHGNAKLQSSPEYSSGFCKIDHSGIYSFILDNSYSIFKPKTAKIWISVLEE